MPQNIEEVLDALSRALSAVRRMTVRQVLVIGAWLIYLFWTGQEALQGLAGLGSPYPGFFVGVFAINFWAFVAALLLAVAVVNPRNWGNGRRLALGCTAAAMVVGHLTGGNIGLMLLSAWGGNPLGFLVAPFGLLLGGMVSFFAVFLVVAILAGVFIAAPVALFNQIFALERSLTIYRYQANGLAGYIARALYWLRNEPMPAGAPPDKGARFAAPPEILAVYKPNDPKAMAFGHIGLPLFLSTDKHVLVMASTRSGKGVTLIVPHLLRYQGSAFVLDPKGENARATGRHRATLNDKVHYLDPFGITGKPQSRFNPLSRFTPENMEAESKALAAALFIIGDRERDHWTVAGQQLLAAIILYVYASPDTPADHKDLIAVRHILLGGIMDALNAMTLVDVADGLLRDLAVSFIETPEKERGSIISSAQRQTEILDNPAMIACLSAKGRKKGDTSEEVDFAAWRSGTMTVYLCLSAPKFPTFNRWLRLVLTAALDEMTDTMNPPALPVCFMLDELATLGHLETVSNAVGLAAGYGVQLVSVFQDVAQMRDLYKGRWASFIGNAGVRAMFSLDDYETAEYWSKFMGGHLVESRNTQQDIYGYSEGDSVGENIRPLMPPEQLMMDFATGKMLVLAQGAHPIVTDRIAYWDDEGLRGLWDDPRGPVMAPPGPRPSRPSPDAPRAPPRPQPPPPGPRPTPPPSPPAPARPPGPPANASPPFVAPYEPTSGPAEKATTRVYVPPARVLTPRPRVITVGKPQRQKDGRPPPSPRDDRDDK